MILLYRPLMGRVIRLSKYTVQLKNIVESKSDLDFFRYESREFTRNLGVNPPSYEETIQAAIPFIFDFDYPIFAESYRNVLNTKILKHFYFREIAFETYGQWKMKLDEKLNLIMPYYNQLYNSQGLDFDPFNDTDYEISHTGDIEKIGLYKGENSLTHGENTSSNLDVTSENTKKTDNTDTINLTNTHTTKSTTSTDDQGNETITKGTKVVTDYTGTQRNDGTKHEENSGEDSTEFEGTKDSSGSTNQDNTHWNFFDDTPQGAIDNIEKNGYYTNVTKDTNDNKETTKGKDTENDTSVTLYGKTVHTTDLNTRTDNLKSSEQESGTDSKQHVIGIETILDGTESDTQKKTDVLDGTVKDNGTRKEVGTGKRDFTDTKKDKHDEDIRTSEDWLRHIVGKRGTKTYASILLEWRETFLNIDRMILEELEDLFFLLW